MFADTLLIGSLGGQRISVVKQQHLADMPSERQRLLECRVPPAYDAHCPAADDRAVAARAVADASAVKLGLTWHSELARP